MVPFLPINIRSRIEEIRSMGLQWQDIDFGESMISIERERLGAIEKAKTSMQLLQTIRKHRQESEACQ